MRFLANMGLSLTVVDHLRSNGRDVIHLAEQQLQLLADPEIFTKANCGKRVIRAFDLDFAEIVAMAKGSVVSVILFRLKNCREDHVISRLEFVIERSAAELDQGCIIAVEETRHRIRKLPIGS